MRKDIISRCSCNELKYKIVLFHCKLRQCILVFKRKKKLKT